MEILKIKVEGLSSPVKIRDYLKRYGFSTSLIAIVKFDLVSLNGRTVHMREPVFNGDIITVRLPDEKATALTPINIPIEVLYEDDYIIAVNKPYNMPTHPSRGNSLPTLADAIRNYFGHPIVFRAVTRLDRDTSGIVLIAKDRITASRLSGLMKAGRILKYYTALVSGVPDKAEGVIDAPIRREVDGGMLRIVAPDGKEAITKYKTVATTPSGNSILEVNPITGRTHQIRVHLAHIGHPLVGDFLYGKRIEGETYKLHCSALRFPHPYTGDEIYIRSMPSF